MKKISIIAAVAAASIATPALAQDIQIFAGPIVGYDNVKVKDGGVSENMDDVFYGVVAGADFNLGGGFVGIEGEFSDSEAKQTVSDILTNGDEGTISADRNFYVGARAGLNISENTKVYVKGGYSNFRVSGTYTPNNTAAVLEVKDDLDGFVIGAGAEHRIASNILLRAEYRYSDYGDANLFDANVGADISRHQVAAGVLFAF